MQRWSPTAERKRPGERRGISRRGKNTCGKRKYQGKKGNIREKEEYLGKGEISRKKEEYQGERRIPGERGNRKSDLIIEVVKISRDKYVNVAHNLQHVQTLKKKKLK